MISFRMALRSISGNKLRAALTMLGIVIGVMALVVLVSLVSGATSSVTDAVSSLGSNLFSVTISDDKGAPVNAETLEEWKEKYDFIGEMTPIATTSVTAKYGTDSTSVTVYGTTPAYYDIEGMTLFMGRFLKTADVENHSRICVINEGAASDLIGYSDCVGKVITLSGIKYTVVGVLKDEDSSLTSSFGSGSKVAYVPYTSLERLSTTVTGDYTTFYATPAEGYTIDDLNDKMEEILLERFEDDEDAFTISATNAIEEAMSSVTSVLSVLLGCIAGISLLVGGIGIMNIMMVTVTERTREIGIRKAIGADRGTILRQFLMEAVVLCMMGCAIGIFLSWSLLRIAAVIVSSLNMSFSLNGTVVVIAVVFCFLIGLIFGLYPANKAAKMKPIDALHYGG